MLARRVQALEKQNLEPAPVKIGDYVFVVKVRFPERGKVVGISIQLQPSFFLDEGNETVNLTLSSPVNASLGSPSTATITIIDNDPTPTVQFSEPDYTVGEADGTATITVTLSAASGQTVTVSYATSNGAASAGSDYYSASGQLTFNPGQTSQTFTVTIIDDTSGEASEDVNLTLSSPSNATLGTQSTSKLWIVDDDPCPAP